MNQYWFTTIQEQESAFFVAGVPETSRGRLAPAPAEGDDTCARSMRTLVHGSAMRRIAAATDSAVMMTGEKEGPWQGGSSREQPVSVL